MADRLAFDFAVPDELLKETVAKVKDPEVVADVATMPGTGEGKPPPLTGILRQYGYAPLVVLTVAALVPNSFVNGISLIGNNLEHAFHIRDAALGAVTFVASVAQLLWAVPTALLADRGSRKLVAGLTLIVFAVVAPFMGLSPNVWWFVFLYLIASVGVWLSNTVHNSYLADAYPTEGRGRVFSWHNISDPLSQTVGILVFGYVVAATGNWRWGMLVAAAGLPIGFMILKLREPEKGANESSHILRASGLDLHSQQGEAPRVLLGSAITRILRIRSIYYELVAVAILGFAGTAAPLFGNLYFVRQWHAGIAERTDIYTVIGLAAFLGLPCAYIVGDRYFRKSPHRPLIVAGVAIIAYGALYVISLYMPDIELVVLFQFLAAASVAPISICIFLTLAATAPPEMRTICFAMFGVYSLVFGGFTGAVLLGAVSESIGGAHGVIVALTIIGPVCALGGILLMIGSRYVKRDVTMVIEGVIERYQEGKRRQEGGAIPALQVHNLDFFYGSTQILFDVNLEVAQGEVMALLGTNGAGKSTLLRVVAGLEHPHRGVVRHFGVNGTYLEPEQIVDQGVALLVGGKMTFPGLTVRDNLKIGEFSLRRERSRWRRVFQEAAELFPELAARLDQPAGTLSGGEQQMLALARVMMTEPRLLMIDELALGLAPMTVDRLMEIVRAVSAKGTTVILVEQSVNRAMNLAERAVFLERGAVRFDGPTAELLERPDLLRPVFLGAVGDGLGGASPVATGAPSGAGASSGAGAAVGDGRGD